MTTKETAMPTTEYTIEPGKQDIISTVVLDAPRDLVFKAYTDPKLFAQWWGPARYKNVIEKFDARTGGEWRVIQRGDDGGEHAFRGVNHSVEAPERICQTFESLGNKTRVTAQIVFQSVMDRDGMVASGMKSGAHESMERLAELLENLKKGK